MTNDFPGKDQPLRDDVRELGALVGEMLREQEGDEFFELVENTRITAIRARESNVDAEDELTKIVAGLKLEEREKLVRAFSAYFGAVNMGEQIHRLRRRRDYESSGAQPNGPLDLVKHLHDEGVSAEDAEAAFADLILEPVFTAHPTEAVRRTLLTKQQRIARALVDRIDPGAMTPVENQRALNRVREEVTAAWQTEEHFDERPKLEDEVEHVLFYLRRVIYRIMPPLFEAFERAFLLVYERAQSIPSFVRFGSWVGGDMDGNPYVGADTIWKTLERQRDAILQLYREETGKLIDHLSQSESRVGFSPELRKLLRHRTAEFPHEIGQMPVRHHDMPYRVLLSCMRAKLFATTRGDSKGYPNAQALESDIEAMLHSLADNNGARAGLHRVSRFLRRVQSFGFHFATLDTRQDAEVYRRVCGVLLGIENYESLGADERAAALREAMGKPPLGEGDEGTTDTLDVFRTIARARRTFGERAIGPSIISMAQGADDVLSVLYLARVADLVEDNQVPLDIAPLFETVDDLDNARKTLEIMLNDELYRAHLEARGNVQHVMLGYSDSGKDSGIASARWALYRAQEELVKAADRAGIKLVLFHGRGGTVSRGGTKVTEAIPAQPPGSVRHRLRVTEQGEIIHSRYGLRGIAQRTLEVTAASVLKFSMKEDGLPRPQPAQRAVLDAIANESRKAYRQLVHSDPRLFEYYRLATPLDVITRMRIGSRPSSRRKQQGIEDLRAIPWVFAWTQARVMLPGWYGVGAGLRHAIDEFGLSRVRLAADEWPVLRTLLGDVEMVMAKADLDVAERYARLAGDVGAELFPEIKAEFERTRELVCEVREINELLESEPWLARAIKLRNPYIDPMSVVQVQLLAEWRKGDRKDTALERALFTTVKGIARGLMNTG